MGTPARNQHREVEDIYGGTSQCPGDQTGTIGVKHAASSEIVRINVGPDRYMLHTSKERGGRAHDLAGPVTALTLSEIDLYLLDFLERGGVS